jgi:hypothetical protein
MLGCDVVYCQTTVSSHIAKMGRTTGLRRALGAALLRGGLVSSEAATATASRCTPLTGARRSVSSYAGVLRSLSGGRGGSAGANWQVDALNDLCAFARLPFI